MLSILNNPVGVSARNNLDGANSVTGKSIQRLSSGLRINGAADDPSGLAISERLRTQIRGLGRASMNAQDAISYFQTAEGALNETHSVLQRMRELSIQAANGTLTSSDRQAIQSEVSQLTDEVDRIATSTEFNTKKLLNGDAAALWSSSSDKVGAMIRGRVAEGNYELEINQTPVENHVLKTDIFSVKDGVQSVDNLDLNGTKAYMDSANGLGAVDLTTATNITFRFDDGTERIFTADSNAQTASIVTAINSDEILSKYIRAYQDTAGIQFEAIREGEYGNNFQVRSNSFSAATTGSFAGLTSAWSSFTAGATSQTGVTVVSGPDHLYSGATGTAAYTVTVTDSAAGTGIDSASVLARYAQTVTDGFSSASTLANIGIIVDTGAAAIIADTVSAVTIKEGGATLMLEVLETKGYDSAAEGNVLVRFSFDEGSTWTEKNIFVGSDTVTGEGLRDTAGAGVGVKISDGVNTVFIRDTTAGAKPLD